MALQGALAIFLVFGICVLLPLGIVAAGVWLILRWARARHEERMAMISQGIAPPADGSVVAPNRAALRGDPARGIGWAVGLLVAGVVWIVGGHHFAALLLGAGAALLTNGILGMRRDAAAGSDPTLPPGGPR